MRDYLRQLPFGAWAGLVIIGLGLWSASIMGVVLGGVLAVVAIIATDKQRQEPPEDEAPLDDRFKKL